MSRCNLIRVILCDQLWVIQSRYPVVENVASPLALKVNVGMSFYALEAFIAPCLVWIITKIMAKLLRCSGDWASRSTPESRVPLLTMAVGMYLLTPGECMLVKLVVVASLLANMIPFLSLAGMMGLEGLCLTCLTQAPFTLVISCISSKAARGEGKLSMRWSYPLHLKHLWAEDFTAVVSRMVATKLWFMELKGGRIGHILPWTGCCRYRQPATWTFYPIVWCSPCSGQAQSGGTGWLWGALAHIGPQHVAMM